jgi:hypothetical protein
MQFLYPQFLWALSLLSIPIIIHLFHFRRFKTVYFSNTRFIQHIKNEKQTKTRLKHLLVLISRLLVIALLVFAFAQPYFPGKSDILNSGKVSVSIYLDNSRSMENTGQKDILFEQARKKAIKIVESYPDNAEFQILTNLLKTKEEKYYNQEQAIKIIEELQLASSSRNLKSIIDKIQSTKANLSSHAVYLFSDFQKSMVDFSTINLDTTSTYYIIKEEAISEDNLSIDSAWFEGPFQNLGQSNILKVRLSNNSKQDIPDLKLTLDLNGSQKITSYSIPKESQSIIDLEFQINKTAWNKGRLIIEDYPNRFDDIYYFSFFVKSNSHVLHISEHSNTHIEHVFETDPFFDFSRISPSKYNPNQLNKQELIILDALTDFSSNLRADIIQYLQNGGNVLIIPPSDTLFNPNTYKQLFNDLMISPFEKIIIQKQSLTNISETHPFFSGIFEQENQKSRYAQVSRYFSKSKNRYYTEEKLLSLQNGDAILSISQVGRGNAFVLNTALHPAWSTLSSESIFLPMLYNCALYHNSKMPIAYEMDVTRSFSLSQDMSLSNNLRMLSNDKDFIPSYTSTGGEYRFFLTEDYSEPGFYTLTSSNADDENHPVVSINGNTRESELESFSIPELRELSKTLSFNLLNHSNDKLDKQFLQHQHKHAFWKILLFAALLFLLVEILLIRLMR